MSSRSYDGSFDVRGCACWQYGDCRATHFIVLHADWEVYTHRIQQEPIRAPSPARAIPGPRLPTQPVFLPGPYRLLLHEIHINAAVIYTRNECQFARHIWNPGVSAGKAMHGKHRRNPAGVVKEIVRIKLCRGRSVDHGGVRVRRWTSGMKERSGRVIAKEHNCQSFCIRSQKLGVLFYLPCVGSVAHSGDRFNKIAEVISLNFMVNVVMTACMAQKIKTSAGQGLSTPYSWPSWTISWAMGFLTMCVQMYHGKVNFSVSTYFTF